MAFSEDIKTRAMVACGRCCCICHKFCGNNMEVHHIRARADGGTDTYDNAIPLCFDCHAEVRQYDPKHPNLSGILFPLVYSGFRRFLICFTYSLTILFPLFPGVPAPYVVIYVVKNASRPVFGESSPVPSGKRFSLLLAAL